MARATGVPMDGRVTQHPPTLPAAVRSSHHTSPDTQLEGYSTCARGGQEAPCVTGPLWIIESRIASTWSSSTGLWSDPRRRRRRCRTSADLALDNSLPIKLREQSFPANAHLLPRRRFSQFPAVGRQPFG